MDPYEYLLHEKLNCYWCEIPNEDKEFELKRNGYTVMTVPGFYRTYKFVYQRLVLILQDLFIAPLNQSGIAFYKKVLNEFYGIFTFFPQELESKEHVDLLLTLYGMNKEA